jgi:hypothetical protein
VPAKMLAELRAGMSYASTDSLGHGHGSLEKGMANMRVPHDTSLFNLPMRRRHSTGAFTQGTPPPHANRRQSSADRVIYACSTLVPHLEDAHSLRQVPTLPQRATQRWFAARHPAQL